ncbi:hypothetical protein B0H10DRAFT_2017782 [Mycena sp. CBHHK59/15]|nr:hypothetical protein B0H10DRAFT_2017782 [Mycena sp. CBHHK59/15]
MDSFPGALFALLSISFSVSFLVHCLHHRRLWHSFFSTDSLLSVSYSQICINLSALDIGAHHPIDRSPPLLVYASPHNPLRTYDLCIK